jgi:RNA polymerase sigma-70 factor (ECF subfamily)
MNPVAASPDDHERFVRLLLEHEPRILRAVMVFVPQRSDARDIVQDTAVALWQHFAEYDASRPFTNWALGYARMHVRRYFRAAARHNKLSEKAAEALLIASEDRDALEDKRNAALRNCLGGLPADSRCLIEGYYYEEKPVEVLGRTHGKSVEAIYKSIQRLRRSLHDCINRRLAEA